MTNAKDLVRYINGLESRLENLERNKPQGYSSLDATSILIRDENGNVTGKIGQLDDGSTGFETYLPNPEEVPEPRVLAVPSAPLLDEGVGNVVVTWDGQTVDEAELPRDFSCVEVHVSQTPDFTADETTVMSALWQTEGSSAVVGPIISGTWYFRLRLRAQNGEVSEQSEIASVEQELDLGELLGTIENASGGDNIYSPTKPTGGEYGPNDIWFDTSEDPETGLVSYMPHKWDAELGDWVSIEDQRIKAIQDAQADLLAEIDAVAVSADGKSSIYYKSVAPTASDPGKLGDIWYRYSGSTVTAVYYYTGTAWSTRTFTNTVLASLDAAKITTGYLDVARLKANSIGADKLLIGIDKNLIPNGELSTGNAAGWPTGMAYSTDAPPEYSGSVSVSNAASYDFSSMGKFPVQAGDVIVFEMWVKASKANSGVYLYVRNQAGASIADPSNPWLSVEGGGAGYYTPLGMTVPTTWTKVISKLKIPAGSTSINLAQLSTNTGSVNDAVQSFAGLKLYKQVGKTLIQDGAVQTDHLAAKSITSASGVVGDLDAGNITFGTMSGLRIAAGTIYSTQLNSTAIDGMTITGATIRTSATGARVQMNISGLSVYNNSGACTFFADASNGALSIVGTLSTSTPGVPRVRIDNSLWSTGIKDEASDTFVDGAGIRIETAGGAIGGQLYSARYSATSGTSNRVVLTGPNPNSGHLAINQSGTAWMRNVPFENTSSTDPLGTIQVWGEGTDQIGMIDNSIYERGSSKRLISYSRLRSTRYNLSAPTISIRASDGDASPNRGVLTFNSSGSFNTSVYDDSQVEAAFFFASPTTRMTQVAASDFDGEFTSKLTQYGETGEINLYAKNSIKFVTGSGGDITGLPIAGGHALVEIAKADTPSSVAVTFPAGRFADAPNVSVTAESTVPGKTVTGVGATGISKNGFTAWATRTNTTNTGLQWTAVRGG